MSIESQQPTNSNDSEQRVDPSTIETPSAHEVRAAVMAETQEDHDQIITKERRFGRGVMVGVPLAITGVLAGGSALLMSTAEHTDPNANTNTSSSTGETDGTQIPTAPVVESPLASPTNLGPLETAGPSAETKEELIKSLELKVNQSNEALSADIIGKMSAWKMAGATPENYKNRDITLTVEDYAAKIAAEQGEIYATAIFGSDYAANPQLANYVNAMIKVNARNIVYYIKTFDPKFNSENIEPYKQVMIMDGLASASPTPDGLKLVIDYRHEANTGKNFIDSSGLNGLKESMTVTLAEDGDTYIATYADAKRR